MSSTLILPDPASWTFSVRYDFLNNVCTYGNSLGSFRGITLYENGTARHKSIHATQLWIYFVDSSQGDAELFLSVLDQTIRHTFLSTLPSSPYAGCVRKVLLADGLSPQIDMALDIIGRFRTGATGLSPSAHAFTFTNIEYLTSVGIDDPGVVPSSQTTTAPSISSEKPSSASSAVSSVESPSASSVSTDNQPGAGSHRGRSQTPLIIACAVGGFIAIAGFLVVLARLRSRRNRRARRSEADMPASLDWTEYALQARSATPTVNPARGSAFMAVPTQYPDVDERDAVLFDASIAARSMALYDAMGLSDGTRSPLLSKSEKMEQQQEERAAPGPSTQSTAPSASHVDVVPAVVHRSTTRATAWDEPPPEYSI